MDIDANLVERAKNGDSKAWDELYLGTHQIAFGVAMQLVKNKDTAEDIIQDSYITAFTKLDTLKEQDKFQHWFNRIVANNCKNYLVKKKPDLFSQHATYTEDGEELEFDVVDERTEYQPDNAVITDEIKQLFYDMVAKLPEEQRACALMFWVQDLSITEIADILGVSQNTVKSRIHYARKKLTAEADDMKKRGESIFSITGFALIPFLRWLFKNDTSFAASPEKAEGILKICKSAGTATKAAGARRVVTETIKTTAKVGSTAKGVATVGAGAVTKGIATKIIAGVLAAAIGIGGVTLAVKNSNSDNVKDDTTTQFVETTKEKPTEDEIIIASSVADLGLNEEMVKAVTAIMSTELANSRVDDVFSFSSDEKTNWFRTYWVYDYIISNDLYEGNELKRNDEFQNEIVSKYGELENSIYPDKELCGIPDYNSFRKLYKCLFGDGETEDEYEQLKAYVIKKQGFPMGYDLRPFDLVPGLDNVEFISLDDDEYQVKYALTTRHSTGDIEVPVDDNSNYSFAYCEPQEVYEYVMSFKMDENSPLGIVVTDSSWGEVDSFYKITYVTKDGKEETVTCREDFENIISPDFVFPTPEDKVESTQKNESLTQKEEPSTRKSNDDLVEIDLFSTIDTIGIETNTSLTSYDDVHPLVITFNDDYQIDYGVCKISWTEPVLNDIQYTIEYKDKNNQITTEKISIIFDTPRGSEYVNGEKIPARLNKKNGAFSEFGFVFSTTEKQMDVDYVYKLMRDDNISNTAFNTLKKRAMVEAEKEYGSVTYEASYVVAKSPKYYGSNIIYIFKQESTGRYMGYYYSNMITNQYGDVLDIDERKPSLFKQVGLYETIDDLMKSFGSKAGSDGIIIELKK